MTSRWRWVLGILLVMGVVPAWATVAVKVTPRQQAARADLVVQARVLDAHSQWNEDHTHIITLTRVAVHKAFKGAPATELLVRQYGGTVGNLRSRVDGDGRFEPGQDVVLFLKRGNGNVVYLFAMAQSVAVVEPGEDGKMYARFDPHGTVYALPKKDGPTPLMGAQEERVPLDALLRDIAAGARGGAQ